MSIVNIRSAGALSRRRMIARAGYLAVGAGLLAASPAFAAAAKLPKSAVAYQDKPKGKARCDNCVQWQPPAGCKSVAGVISPVGWCAVYAPKS